MLDEGVFDHLEARLYPDWLGVKCNRALVPAVREFLTFLCGLLRENGRAIACLIQITFPFSPNKDYWFLIR